MPPTRGGHELRALWERCGWPLGELSDPGGVKAFYIEKWNTDLRYEGSMPGNLPADALALVGGARQLAKWIQNRVRRFTRNRVRNRLADANEDHSPRYLLQLFQEGLKREREEHRRSPYDRSVLRPRVLTESLPEVSQQALAAFNEEFPELTALLDRLQSIGRTPVVSEQITGDEMQEHLALAREVGLMAPYEVADEAVLRYKVPELYRWALKMSRMGQRSATARAQSSASSAAAWTWRSHSSTKARLRRPSMRSRYTRPSRWSHSCWITRAWKSAASIL